MSRSSKDDSATVVSKKGKKRESSLWTDEMHMAFLELCLNELKLGNKPGTHFNKARYENLIKNMEKKVSKAMTQKQLKNHWENMKADWKLYDRLMRIESGIGWDHMRHTIDATDEWWDEKIKGDPDLETFRGQDLDMYKTYYEPLFRDSVAVGDRTKAPANYENMTFGVERKGDSDEVHIINDEVPMFPQCSLSKRKRSTKEKATAFDEKLDVVLQAISSRSTHTFPPQNVSHSTKDCMDIVSTYPDFEEGSNMYCEALDIFLSKQARENFMVPTTNDAKMKFLNL